jgi:hypothetical protein
MRNAAVLILVLAAMLAPSLSAQIMPPDCQCVFQSNSYPQTVGGIGTVDATSSCQYATQGSDVGCQVIGVISYTSSQTGAWQFGFGSWGQPFTVIPSLPGSQNFTHTANFKTCGTGTTSSFFFVSGTIGGNRLDLGASRVWSCDGAN